MYVPAKGSVLTVDLPGERMRCTVRRVLNRSKVEVVVDGTPMAKSHTFRSGDVVTVERARNELGEIWAAEDKRP